MLLIQKAALLLAGVVGFQSMPGEGPAPMNGPLTVTVLQVLTTQALVGERVQVTGRCLGKDAPVVARGSRPFSGGTWQLEDNGVAAWVLGPMPKSCNGGTATITAQVVQDSLPRLSPPRTLRQFLVVR
jgi:hypothetical protein